MLTIFSIPKPFGGHIGVIQENAVASWRRLEPSCEIILYGNEGGIAEIAQKYQATHVPEVARNEFGTPLVSAVFDHVREAASQPLICYVNADIILLPDFLDAVRRIPWPEFLMVGRRWNVDLLQVWDFDAPAAQENLREFAHRQGVQDNGSGSDYFVLPRSHRMHPFPLFAVGRPGWDNWLLYKARALGIPLVDATRATTVVHQNHDYSHIPQRTGGAWEGPEADRNRQLMGGPDHQFLLLDATHVLTPHALRPASGFQYFKRRLYTLPVFVPAVRPLLAALLRVRNLFRRPPPSAPKAAS